MMLCKCIIVWKVIVYSIRSGIQRCTQPIRLTIVSRMSGITFQAVNSIHLGILSLSGYSVFTKIKDTRSIPNVLANSYVDLRLMFFYCTWVLSFSQNLEKIFTKRMLCSSLYFQVCTFITVSRSFYAYKSLYFY